MDESTVIDDLEVPKQVSLMAKLEWVLLVGMCFPAAFTAPVSFLFQEDIIIGIVDSFISLFSLPFLFLFVLLLGILFDYISGFMAEKGEPIYDVHKMYDSISKYMSAKESANLLSTTRVVHNDFTLSAHVRLSLIHI